MYKIVKTKTTRNVIVFQVSMIIVGLGVEVSKPITNPRTCPMESLSPVVYFEQLWKPSSISMPVRQRSLR